MNTDYSQPENAKLIAKITESPPSVYLDYALYEHYLAECDLTEDQKREFLDTLWSIIVAFVDLGFGVHPVQQVSDREVCGQESLQPSLPTTSKAGCATDEGTSNHHAQSKYAESFALAGERSQE